MFIFWVEVEILIFFCIIFCVVIKSGCSIVIGVVLDFFSFLCFVSCYLVIWVLCGEIKDFIFGLNFLWLFDVFLVEFLMFWIIWCLCFRVGKEYVFVLVFVVDLFFRFGKFCECLSFNFCLLVIGILVELLYLFFFMFCKEWFLYNGFVVSFFIDFLILISLLEIWVIFFLWILW